MSDSKRKMKCREVQCASCKYERLGYCQLWARQVAVYSKRICEDYSNKHK